MTKHIDGSWQGWSGGTIVQLTDGSAWRQDEYHYEYQPVVAIVSGKIQVAGIGKAVRVRRLR